MSKSQSQPDDPMPEMSESDVIFGEMNGDSGETEVIEQLFEDWLPEGDDWLAKTNLSPDQVSSIASLRLLVKMDDDIKGEVEEAVLLWLEMIMKGQTSIDGRSREDIIRTFETLGSSSSQGGQTVIGTISDKLTGEDEDDE